jgi:hypothetical protein
VLSGPGQRQSLQQIDSYSGMMMSSTRLAYLSRSRTAASNRCTRQQAPLPVAVANLPSIVAHRWNDARKLWGLTTNRSRWVPQVCFTQRTQGTTKPIICRWGDILQWQLQAVVSAAVARAGAAAAHGLPDRSDTELQPTCAVSVDSQEL